MAPDSSSPTRIGVELWRDPIAATAPRRLSFSLLAGLMSFLLMVALATAQQAARDADAKWNTLQQRALPAVGVAGFRGAQGGARSEAQRRKDNEDLAAYFRGVADEAKAFREQNDGHAKAREARLLETRSLLRAAFLGDKSQGKRLQELVAGVEGDSSIPSKERYQVIALADHLLIRELARNSAEAKAARLDSARYLISHFPSEAGGYLGLLSAADAAGAAQARGAAQEVLAAPDAPFAAKAAARNLIARHELVGKSLADVANTALGRDNFFEQARGRQTVLYTWSAASPGSLAFARQVVAKLPAEVLVIGYNLDRDTKAAEQTAKQEKLPGVMYFNEGGSGAWVALLLKLDAPGLAYVTDKAGVIREIAGQRSDLFTALAGKK